MEGAAWAKKDSEVCEGLVYGKVRKKFKAGEPSADRVLGGEGGLGGALQP